MPCAVKCGSRTSGNRPQRRFDRQPDGEDDRDGPRHGYDGGKKTKGRNPRIFVDTLGLLLAVVIPAPRGTTRPPRRKCSGNSTTRTALA